MCNRQSASHLEHMLHHLQIHQPGRARRLRARHQLAQEVHGLDLVSSVLQQCLLQRADAAQGYSLGIGQDATCHTIFSYEHLL